MSLRVRAIDAERNGVKSPRKGRQDGRKMIPARVVHFPVSVVRRPAGTNMIGQMLSK